MGAAVLGSPSARRRLPVLGLTALLVVLVGPGCGGHRGDAGVTCSNPASTVVRERAVDVSYRGPGPEVDALLRAPRPRLVVQLTSSRPSVERVRLAFDGTDALDVDLPASSGCSHPPVFSVAYDRPPGPVVVDLDVQGATSTSTIDVPATGTVWAVVDVQSKRAWSDVTVYDTQPVWG